MGPTPQAGIKPGFLNTGSSSGKLVTKSSGKCCKCFLDRSTAQITCDLCLIFICDYCHWCEDIDHEIRKCQTCSRGLCKACCAEIKLCESCGQWMCADCSVKCKVCSKAICGGRAADTGGEICSRGGCSRDGCGNNVLCRNDAHTCYFCSMNFCQMCVKICVYCNVAVCPKEENYLLKCDSGLEGPSCLAFMCFLCILKKDPCPTCNKRPSKALVSTAHKGSLNIVSSVDNGANLPAIQPPAADDLLEPPPLDDDDEEDDDMPDLMEEADQESDSGSDVDAPPKVVAAKPAVKESVAKGAAAPPVAASAPKPATAPKAAAAVPPPALNGKKAHEEEEEEEEPPALLSSDDENDSDNNSDAETTANTPSPPRRAAARSPTSSTSYSFVPTQHSKEKLYPDTPPQAKTQPKPPAPAQTAPAAAKPVPAPQKPAATTSVPTTSTPAPVPASESKPASTQAPGKSSTAAAASSTANGTSPAANGTGTGENEWERDARLAREAEARAAEEKAAKEKEKRAQKAAAKKEKKKKEMEEAARIAEQNRREEAAREMARKLEEDAATEALAAKRKKDEELKRKEDARAKAELDARRRAAASEEAERQARAYKEQEAAFQAERAERTRLEVEARKAAIEREEAAKARANAKKEESESEDEEIAMYTAEMEAERRKVQKALARPNLTTHDVEVILAKIKGKEGYKEERETAKKILKKLQDERAAAAKRASAPSPASNGTESQSPPGPSALRRRPVACMDIDDRVVGYLIGTGGSRLKELIKATEANFRTPGMKKERTLELIVENFDGYGVALSEKAPRRLCVFGRPQEVNHVVGLITNMLRNPPHGIARNLVSPRTRTGAQDYNEAREAAARLSASGAGKGGEDFSFPFVRSASAPGGVQHTEGQAGFFADANAASASGRMSDSSTMPPLKGASVASMSTDVSTDFDPDTEEFLKGLGLMKYMALFQEENLTLEGLKSMTDSDFNKVFAEKVTRGPLIKLKKELQRLAAEKAAKAEETDAGGNCSICWENLPDTALLPCGHTTFCAECLLTEDKQLTVKDCPICRAPVTGWCAL